MTPGFLKVQYSGGIVRPRPFVGGLSPLPDNYKAAPNGVLIDEESGAILYDESTGAAITV